MRGALGKPNPGRGPSDAHAWQFGRTLAALSKLLYDPTALPTTCKALATHSAWTPPPPPTTPSSPSAPRLPVICVHLFPQPSNMFVHVLVGVHSAAARTFFLFFGAPALLAALSQSCATSAWHSVNWCHSSCSAMPHCRVSVLLKTLCPAYVAACPSAWKASIALTFFHCGLWGMMQGARN